MRMNRKEIKKILEEKLISDPCLELVIRSHLHSLMFALTMAKKNRNIALEKVLIQKIKDHKNYVSILNKIKVVNEKKLKIPNCNLKGMELFSKTHLKNLFHSPFIDKPVYYITLSRKVSKRAGSNKNESASKKLKK